MMILLDNGWYQHTGFCMKKFTIYTENILVCPAANMNNTCNHIHTHIMGNKQYMNNDHTADAK